MATSSRLYLVRHGQASAGFAEAHDPGLDERGHQQARAVAQELAPLGPLPILTSPLKRTRETATLLEQLWRMTAQVEPCVAEIPSLTTDLQERTIWLQQALRGRWGELSAFHQQWRDALVAFLESRTTPMVITTHFVAINVAVGAATGDDRMVCFEPDNCSCTVFDVVEGKLRLVSLGRQRATRIR
ncbi:MAG: histidine phosphatase family protein [Deltaproteobacteria bacterium]|nr:histidine phosphatase family protein [Deltaproteobacteria bacterium]